MIETLSSVLLRYRVINFIFSVLLLVFALAGFQYFKFDGSARAFFDKDYQPYLDLELIEEKYGKESRIFIMLENTSGDVFSPELMDIQANMTEQARLLPYIVRVDSLSNFLHTYANDDELIVEALFESDINYSEQQRQRIQAIATQDISLVNRLVTSDAQYSAIALEFNIGKEGQQEKEIKLAEGVYEWMDKVEAANPQLKLYATGDIISTYNNGMIILHDISVMIPAMFGIMFIVLGLIMRTVSGVVSALIISLTAMLVGMGLGAWFGITYSMMTMNAPMIIITVTIAHCIHILNHFFHAYRAEHVSKLDAIVESIRVNYLPVTITSLTTALGFLTLNTSDLPPAAGLGNVSALGVLASWVLSLTMLPAFVMWLPFKKPGVDTGKLEQWMSALATWVIQRQTLLLIFTFMTAVGMAYIASYNTINDRFSEAINEPHKFRAHNEKIDQHFGGLYNYNFEVSASEENGITQVAYLQYLDKFTLWLRSQEDVKSVFSFVDVMKQLNKSMHGDDEAFYRLPESAELAAQYLLLYELSLPVGVDLNNQILLDKSATRVVITTGSADTHKIFELQARVDEWQQEHFPEAMRQRGASMAVMWSQLSYDSFITTLQGSFIALLVISLVMVLVLKSLRYGLISLIPNILPAIIGFGIWALYKGELSMGLTSVVIITMGIVVDDTVHFLSKYKYAKDTFSASTEEAIHYAFKYVGTALWTTSLVLVAGFSLLMVSQVASNSDLGFLTSAIIISALLLDFFLLPPLLLLLDKSRHREST